MPFDENGVDGVLGTAPSVGLRVKKNTNELAGNGLEAGPNVLVQGSPNDNSETPFEEELSQQEQFKLDKKLFA